MKYRATIIFLLTHLYPAFVVGHLYFGDSCRVCQVLFNCCPIAVFGGLFLVWISGSNTPLKNCEKFNLSYLISMIVVVYCYYIICIKSRPEWVYDKNVQLCAFLGITTVFYLLSYGRIKQNAPR